MVRKQPLENGMLAIVDPRFTATPDVAAVVSPCPATARTTALLVAVGGLILAAALAPRRRET